MTAGRAENQNPSYRVGISWTDGVVRLRDEDLVKERTGNLCVLFLRRVFALDEVKWVEIDRDRFSVNIRHGTGRSKLASFLGRLATAIRTDVSRGPATVIDLSLVHDLARAGGRIKIRRFGPILTTWDIVCVPPGKSGFTIR